MLEPHVKAPTFVVRHGAQRSAVVPSKRDVADIGPLMLCVWPQEASKV